MKVFHTMLILWEAAMETERRCFLKVIATLNITPIIARSILTPAGQFHLELMKATGEPTHISSDLYICQTSCESEN